MVLVLPQGLYGHVSKNMTPFGVLLSGRPFLSRVRKKGPQYRELTILLQARARRGVHWRRALLPMLLHLQLVGWDARLT